MQNASVSHREQRATSRKFGAFDRAPSYVELLTCLEIAKQAAELPEESKAGVKAELYALRS
jgi:hypothetical protein